MMSCKKKETETGKFPGSIPGSTRSLVFQDVSGTVGAPHLWKKRNHIRELEQQLTVRLRDAGLFHCFHVAQDQCACCQMHPSDWSDLFIRM